MSRAVHPPLMDVIASQPSRERDLVCAMIASQILEPDSKLAFTRWTRWWENTTIPDVFGVGMASEDELYSAMDWLFLFMRQPHIEKKLAARHLAEEIKEGHRVRQSLSQEEGSKPCDLKLARGTQVAGATRSKPSQQAGSESCVGVG